MNRTALIFLTLVALVIAFGAVVGSAVTAAATEITQQRMEVLP